MYSSEELARQIKLISQNAWRQEGNTTLNSMVEYIVREALELVMEIIIEQQTRIEALEELAHAPVDLQQVFDDAINLREIQKDGKDGGVSQPQGNTQSTTTTRPRANAKPRNE